MLFKCPKCGGTALFENEIRPVITRDIRGVDTRYNCTKYETYWCGGKGRIWWTCGTCCWELPVTSFEGLIAFLDRQRSLEFEV